MALKEIMDFLNSPVVKKSYPQAKKEADVRKRENAEMAKRITETSYQGKNVSPDKKGPKKVIKKETIVEAPEGLRGSVDRTADVIGPNMGNRSMAEAYADAQALDAANRITEGGTDFSRMSRTAEPEEARIDMHEQARRSMGFKKGGMVKKKSSSCGMKSGGSVKSSASRRGDGCAVRGKTKGRMI
jgi:hypothetical protein